MTTNTYVIKSVWCDFSMAPDCVEEYEGFPGVSASEVRRHAQELGWQRKRRQDICPQCVKEWERLYA